ncbi:MAG TPA: hypothetical protein VEZ11_11380 [Thermoanaerobaculia bacterium]|nr:hypothetical protein [Thermoanaerobaculia bacterium]
MNDLLDSRRGSWIIGGAIVVVFLALRIALLWAREPFFDELFTLWIAQKPLAGILEALRHDSGPPLYYFVVHALTLHSVDAVRLVSLAAATATLGIVLTARPFGKARFVAAALLAIYPPAVLFAIDARAYALCAMFVAAGIVALTSDRPVLAAAAFVAAAYSHYYGALFFPLLLIKVPSGETETNVWPEDAGGERRRPRNGVPLSVTARSAGVFAAAVVLFAPGIWLALHQPREAMLWLHEPRWPWIGELWFAGRYPYSLFAPSPLWLVVVAAVLVLIAIGAPLMRGAMRAPLLAFTVAATLIPLTLASIAGVYFPMRLESVIAVPLMLWIAISLEACAPVLRRAVAAAFLVIGAAVVVAGISDHAARPVDPYRSAAMWTAAHVQPAELVVASGYCYLEAVTFVHARVVAMPPEQAVHPGWRAFPEARMYVPPAPFLWIGERAAPELSILRKARNIKPLYVNDRAIVAAVR